MNDLKIRVCAMEDLDMLAALNKQLIEDEQHDNTMNTDQLKERMAGFIQSGYRAYLFENQGRVIGYALVNHEREPLYLRQFFICRDSRRQGYGRRCFAELTEALGTEEIDIEVMHWNERGYRFWKRLGFAERSVYMRLGGKSGIDY